MEVFSFAWSGRAWIDMAIYVDALASGVCASMGDHRRPGHFPAVRVTGGAGGYFEGEDGKSQFFEQQGNELGQRCHRRRARG